MPELFKPFQTGNFWLGLGTAVAFSVLGPTLGKVAKPAAVKGVHGMLFMSEKMVQMAEAGKEQLSKFVDSTKKATENVTSSVLNGGENLREVVDRLQAENSQYTEEILRLQTQVQELRGQVQQFNTSEI